MSSRLAWSIYSQGYRVRSCLQINKQKQNNNKKHCGENQKDGFVGKVLAAKPEFNLPTYIVEGENQLL